jgi:hypothetical protein
VAAVAEQDQGERRLRGGSGGRRDRPRAGSRLVYTSGGQSIQNWTGTGGQAYLSGTGRGWVFHCTDYRTEAHTLSLDDEQWTYLIRPGSPGPTLNTMLTDA